MTRMKLLLLYNANYSIIKNQVSGPCLAKDVLNGPGLTKDVVVMILKYVI